MTSIEDDIADHGEGVRLSFGTLPPGVSAGATATATVTFIDDDPAVTVSIAQATYEVVEGERLDVTIMLSAAPQRPVAIPLTITNQGGADSNDHNLNPVYTVDFEPTFYRGGVSFRVSGDTLVERGEGVKVVIGSDLPPGVTLGTNGEATITFIDDDPAVTVSFGATTYSVAEGDDVEVTVTLSADPRGARDHTHNRHRWQHRGGATSTDDYADPTSVTFNSGDTMQTLSFSVTEDTVEDHGESVRLSFGTPLPPGVTASGTTTTTVTIIDDDPALEP